MKKSKKKSGMIKPALGLMALTDVFFSFLVYIASPKTFGVMTAVIVLFSAAVLTVLYLLEQSSEKKRLFRAWNYLEKKDEDSLERFRAVMPGGWPLWCRALADELSRQQSAIEDGQYELKDYEEFIEQWTHEIKTPLSLTELVLSNHSDEMSPYVLGRLRHVQYQIRSDVDRILYYARSKADHMDYRFETVSLSEALLEVTKNFSGMIQERGLAVNAGGEDVSVMTDRRILLFILSQILSNAVKYAPAQGGVIDIRTWETVENDEKSVHLKISDNGPGVPPQDLPFIFDKGFCGSSPDRQHSTGMGLYLVKKYAALMAMDIRTIDVQPHGFGIELIWKL